MNITVKARHMDVTDALREYVESKASKLPRYFDHIQSAEVVLDTEADHAVVEIVVTATHRNTFVAVHKDPDMYAAIDHSVRKMSEQLRRHKDKVRDRQGPSLAESAAAGEAEQEASGQ